MKLVACLELKCLIFCSRLSKIPLLRWPKHLWIARGFSTSLFWHAFASPQLLDRSWAFPIVRLTGGHHDLLCICFLECAGPHIWTSCCFSSSSCAALHLTIWTSDSASCFFVYFQIVISAHLYCYFPHYFEGIFWQFYLALWLWILPGWGPCLCIFSLQHQLITYWTSVC